MVNRVLLIAPGGAGVPVMGWAQELAAFWTQRDQAALIVGSFPGVPGERSEDLWRRLNGLSPALVRSALQKERDQPARLALSSAPPAEDLSQWPALVRPAFQWTLIVQDDPFASPEDILDAVDGLLWLIGPGTDAGPVLRRGLHRLAERHLPYAFSRAVFWDPGASRAPASTGPEGIGVLASFSSQHGSAARLQAWLKLSRALEQIAPAGARRSSPAIDPDPAAVRALKEQVQPLLLDAVSSSKAPSADLIARQVVVDCLAARDEIPASRQERGALVERVLDEVLGLGPLEPLLQDPGISEIMVNGTGSLYVERGGRLEPVGVRLESESQLRAIIDRIVAPLGRRVDEGQPVCDARLPDGSRVHIVLPPLALDGPVVTIRKFLERRLSLEELAARGSLSEAMAAFLREAVRKRRNIVVSGGTGSGKTTLLNALSGAIPDGERIVTIEDAAELRLQKPHVIRLESRPANAEGQGAVPIRQLVINALRMRPDRIVVGECRGGEALDMLQAMNTGHDGSLTTLHANGPRDALGRLETMALMAGLELPVRVVREQIRSAVHLLVHQSRLADGSRKVCSITELTGMEGDLLTTQELFRLRDGRFEATGLVSCA